MSLRALILAAGKGTRMKSEIPKVLHKVNGTPMVKRILNVLDKMNIQKSILILGYKKDLILENITNVDYVYQEKQLGTAHAAYQTRELMKDYDGDVLIINGDLPLITYEDLKKFYDYYKDTSSDLSLLTAIFENPSNYGRIKEANGQILKIIEEKDASEEDKRINKINVGAYLVKSKFLFDALSKINNENHNGEYYLTDIVEIFLNENKNVSTYLIENNENVHGVNSKYELSLVEKIARDRKNKSLMEEGVTLIDPNSTYIEDEVSIGIDTIIYPNVMIQGKTTIGSSCEILSNTRIINSQIANNVKIESSVIEESILDDFVTMGPFAHLRPKSHLKKSVHIGNFVEVKKSILEEGVKSGHLTYLGDSHIGAKTNIGAGTITCNYDGKNKFKTEVGKNVFIGSDSIIVAPVNIGDNSFIGAGSVITKNVPNNSLAVERNQQKIIENWRKK